MQQIAIVCHFIYSKFKRCAFSFFIIGVPLILFAGKIKAQAVDDKDPFKPYIGQVPVIEKDLGTETLANGVKVQRLVFRSRVIETPTGPQTTYVFAAITHPATNGLHPAIIRLHGGGGAAEINVAENFAADGYTTLVLDMPGLAGETVKNPAGSWAKQKQITADPDITHSALFDAMLASVQAFYLLRSQPDVDVNKIGVLGGSWGGYVATMLATMLNKDVAATWAVFGTGNFLKGSNMGPLVEKLPPTERADWVRYLDPGSRAKNVTKPYFISTASNDRHWSWMAVQATLADMKGPINQFYSPNQNHTITYVGSGKALEYFNHYLKKAGPPLPEITVKKAKLIKNEGLRISLKLIHVSKVSAVKIFYSDSDPKVIWTERLWKELPATEVNADRYDGLIPPISSAYGMDWYAIVTDENPAWKSALCSVSTLIFHSENSIKQ